MNMADAYLACYAVIMAVTILALVQIKSFTSSHPRIKNEQDLEDFKAMVRLQMYYALITLVLFCGGGICGVYGLLTDRIGLFLILVVNAIFFGISKIFKAAEERAKMMGVDDELKAEYRAVCDSWVAKALPDF